VEGEAFVRGAPFELSRSSLSQRHGGPGHLTPDVVQDGDRFATRAVDLVAAHNAVEQAPKVGAHLVGRCPGGRLSGGRIKPLEVYAPIKADVRSSVHLAPVIRTKGTMTSSSAIPP